MNLHPNLLIEYTPLVDPRRPLPREVKLHEVTLHDDDHVARCGMKSGVGAQMITASQDVIQRAATMQRIRVVVAAILLTAFARATRAQEAVGQRGGEATLSPGDIVRVAVWREADLSGDFLVDENGVVTLPMLGKVPVVDIPVSRLRDQLLRRYSVELRNPSITVTPLRRIYVLGEVTKPGLYTVDPTISLAGAIALAGGATPTGDLERLRVVRAGSIVLDRAAAASSLSAASVRSDDQIFVDRRGWFDRNSTFAASALLSIVTLTVTMLRR